MAPILRLMIGQELCVSMLCHRTPRFLGVLWLCFYINSCLFNLKERSLWHRLCSNYGEHFRWSGYMLYTDYRFLLFCGLLWVAQFLCSVSSALWVAQLFCSVGSATFIVCWQLIWKLWKIAFFLWKVKNRWFILWDIIFYSSVMFNWSV